MSIIFEVTAYDGRTVRLSEGFIITSYFTQRMRKGVVLWRGIK